MTSLPLQQIKIVTLEGEAVEWLNERGLSEDAINLATVLLVKGGAVAVNVNVAVPENEQPDIGKAISDADRHDMIMSCIQFLVEHGAIQPEAPFDQNLVSQKIWEFLE